MANFVKNHDKLTLDKLSKAERDEVFAALASSQDMRACDRGIRRRVPPMLKGDQRHYPQSLLNWMDRLIRRRKETPQLGWGSFQVVATGDEAPDPAPPGVGRSEDEAKSAAVRPARR